MEEDKLEDIANQLYDIKETLENFFFIFAEVMGRPIKTYNQDKGAIFEHEKTN